MPHRKKKLIIILFNSTIFYAENLLIFKIKIKIAFKTYKSSIKTEIVIKHTQ